MWGGRLEGNAAPRQLKRNLHETVCRQMQTNYLLESLWNQVNKCSFLSYWECYASDGSIRPSCHYQSRVGWKIGGECTDVGLLHDYIVKTAHSWHWTFQIKTLGKQLSSCCAPGPDGLDVCPKIRRLWVRVPPRTKTWWLRDLKIYRE